jgi:hypothetical protein
MVGGDLCGNAWEHGCRSAGREVVMSSGAASLYGSVDPAPWRHPRVSQLPVVGRSARHVDA